MALTSNRIGVAAPQSTALAAFAPVAPGQTRPTGQQSANALYGDFLGGSGVPLAAPNVKAPTTTTPTSSRIPSGLTSIPGASSAFAPLQAPGNNLVNPGYGEQALEYTQNRLLQDPSAGLLQQSYGQTQQQGTGEQFLNQNLGTLQGPGQGDQYWNQVQGQFMDPFAGEQFTRQATQNMSPTGPAGAFFNQAMDQYGNFTGYQGPQNTQGQYGQSSASLAGGTQGEQGLGAIAGQYDSVGRYTDPNLAAGQYAQTQGAFGDLPIAEFDPFYDRARQLATQDYNRQAAGRGVYGSSEALSGVGNVITDIEAQRANRSFDAEMQRAVEQRNRQALLGEQARMGDLSSLGAFGANLSGAETFGNLANMQGNLELNRNQLLGNLANMADTQALGAQNANISGLNAFGNLAGQADTAETNRYQATTNAMNQADRTALDRVTSGADIAFRGDENARQDYLAETGAAANAANIGLNRQQLGANIANQLSANDLARLQAFNQTAQGAEGQRQGRQTAALDATFRQTDQMLGMLGTSMDQLINMGQAEAEQYLQANVVPALQAAGYDQRQIDQTLESIKAGIQASRG